MPDGFVAAATELPALLPLPLLALAPPVTEGEDTTEGVEVGCSASEDRALALALFDPLELEPLALAVGAVPLTPLTLPALPLLSIN